MNEPSLGRARAARGPHRAPRPSTPGLESALRKTPGDKWLAGGSAAGGDGWAGRGGWRGEREDERREDEMRGDERRGADGSRLETGAAGGGACLPSSQPWHAPSPLRYAPRGYEQHAEWEQPSMPRQALPYSAREAAAPPPPGADARGVLQVHGAFCGAEHVRQAVASGEGQALAMQEEADAEAEWAQERAGGRAGEHVSARHGGRGQASPEGGGLHTPSGVCHDGAGAVLVVAGCPPRGAGWMGDGDVRPVPAAEPGGDRARIVCVGSNTKCGAAREQGRGGYTMQHL